MFEAEPREFPSPFAPPVPAEPPVRPPQPVVAPLSQTGESAGVRTGRRRAGAAGDRTNPLDRVARAIAAVPAFFRMITTLAALPPEKLAEAVASWEFWWTYLTPGERGIVIKAFEGRLPDREVAPLAGVARETLLRDERYRDFKQGIPDRPAAPAEKRRRVKGVLRPVNGPGFGHPDRHDPADDR